LEMFKMKNKITQRNLLSNLWEKNSDSHQGKESFLGGRDETCVLTPSTLMKNFVKIEMN